MKLKHFFISLSSQNIFTEIYYREEHLQDDFGFIIKEIDAGSLNSYKENPIVLDIFDCIRDAFISNNSTLEDNFEGNTTYTLMNNNYCIKKANYFCAAYDSHKFWMETKETEYYFYNVELPFCSIIITKEEDAFSIDEEEKLKEVLGESEFLKFQNFYTELLGEFQNMEIQLEVENLDKKVYCSILNMSGFYSEEKDFTLLNSDESNFSREELKSMLINCFEIKPSIAQKVIKYKSS